jgi:hypothetical protein
MIHGRDLQHAAVNWCLASFATILWVAAALLLEALRHIPFMPPL